ncbi:hypothetical protein EVAR_95434_1 [Eumeta japonica]|uniref:Uncharacterized protein n=1 Tax=Eumeta variegata TaxID=151549 RepID=A0A4C1VJG3_EUMVA|nr:hypothetical protein EVAR_95434_1 [Eumeta japonica]
MIKRGEAPDAPRVTRARALAARALHNSTNRTTAKKLQMDTLLESKKISTKTKKRDDRKHPLVRVTRPRPPSSKKLI